MTLRTNTLPVTGPVHITILGDKPERLVGEVETCTGSGMKLRTPRPLPVGGALKIEWQNTLMLGEVRQCLEQEGQFSAGIEIAHALFNTEEIARLARRLLAEDER